MYKIIKDGEVFAMTEALTCIRRQENGCFGMCSEEDAQGIALSGVPYQLLGRPEMEGAAGTVMALEVDGGAKLLEAFWGIGSLEDALCEMDAVNAASIASLEDALCEMDMGGGMNG